MSRKFGNKFAPARRLPPRKPVRCGRCRVSIPVHDTRYPAAPFGEVCASCKDRLAAQKNNTAPRAPDADAKAAATLEQAARLVLLAAEREAEAEP